MNVPGPSPTSPLPAGLRVVRVPLAALVPDPVNAAPHAAPTKRRAVVEVVCSGCGTRRTIRQDSFHGTPPRCRSCANRASGAKARRPRRGTCRPCSSCGESFYASPCEAARRFCSPACTNLERRRHTPQARTCRTCGREFVYTPKPFSNSSGVYCSRACRDAGFLGVVHGDPARPAVSDRFGWRTRRDAYFAAANAFCTLCGRTEGRLHVHHIEGYQQTAFNDLSTVVTVCPAHHRALEGFTRAIRNWPANARHRAARLLKAFLGDSWCLHSGRLLLAGGAP